MKTISEKKMNERKTFRTRQSMSLMLVVLLLIPFNSWAQTNRVPFDGNSFTINGTTSNYIEFRIPFYADAGYDRRLDNSYVSYSIDGGVNYTNLFYQSIGRFESNGSWYWTYIKGSSGHTIQAIDDYKTNPVAVSLSDVEIECKSNSGNAYIRVRWYHNNAANINNKAILFKLNGIVHDNGTGGTLGVEWKLKDPLVVGNPQHKATIKRHSYDNTGIFSVFFNVPGFTKHDDIGSKANGAGSYFVESKVFGSNFNNGTHDTKKPANFYNKSSLPANYNGTGELSMKYNSPVTLAILESGDDISIGSTRSDVYSYTQTSTKKDLFTPGEVYNIPPYPQPKGLTVQKEENGKLKLSWSMTKNSNSAAPNDGFSVQWKRDGEDWTKNGNDITNFYNKNNGNLILQYEKNTESYSVWIDYPAFDEGEKIYHFRIKRANLPWLEKIYVEKPITLNTNKIKLSEAKANVTEQGVSINWKYTAGATSSGWKIRVTRSGSAVGEVDYGVLSLMDLNLIDCTPANYLVELIDGSGGRLSSLTTNTIVRPRESVGSIDNISVSKGYYNDRVSVTWKTSEFANFNYYSITRKVLDDPNSIEQEIYQVNNTKTMYSYDDRDAIPGTYYTYTVNGWSSCDAEPSISSYKSSTGFSQPFGIISGRIAYEGSRPVEGVDVIVEGNSSYSNKSLEFSTSKKTYVKTFLKDNMFVPEALTFQAWVHTRNTEQRALLSAWGKYMIYLEGRDKVVFEYFHGGDAGYRSKAIFTNVPLKMDAYQHITIAYKISGKDKNVSVSLYLDGQFFNELYTEVKISSKDGSEFGYPSNDIIGFMLNKTGKPSSSDSLYLGNGVGANLFLDGFLDEVRCWNRVLTEEEIANNYNRYISGGEDNMALYYRFDEVAGDEVFDLSSSKGVYNGRDGIISGGNSDLRSMTEVPTTSQLSIKGRTDANGNYLINTVPYTGAGSGYTITPLLGVHQFNPSSKPLYFNNSSTTHNSIDFIDISSFKVSGKVYYEGGTYPVEGCNFQVDGRTLVDKYGIPITTNSNGDYEVSVPIGQHEFRVVKTGHTFIDGGLALENGSNRVYNNDVIINFKDRTRVKLIGHIVGGKIEHNKVSGFGERLNNIGAGNITLKAVKEQYLLCGAGSDALQTDTVFNHNQGEWKKASGLKKDSTLMTINGNNISITVSPETGEYVAWLYPEKYVIQPITVSSVSGDIYDEYEMLDLTNTPVSSTDMMQMSIRTWPDSVFVAASGNQAEHYRRISMSDTVRFHSEWKYFYQATPSYSIVQLNNNMPLPWFGDQMLEITDSEKNKEQVVLASEVEGNVNYIFGKPVFSQGKIYTFALKAYEEYRNNNKEPVIVDIVPVIDGTVNFTNALSLTTNPNPIKLDSIGEGVYTFQVGAPDLTTGIKALSSTLEIDGLGYYSNIGKDGMEAYVLGSRTTGTDFITAGPDEITAVLHDPPGGLSYSYLEKGTSITKTTELSVSDEVSLELGSTIDMGAKITTFVGLGAGVIMDTEVILEAEVGVETKTSYKYGNTTEQVQTFTERFETSDDPLYVGHLGDVFIGNSTNIQYGLTNAITLQKKAEIVDQEDIFIEAGSYAIASSTGMAFGQTFGTRFAYTEVELENIMIPKWQLALRSLFQASAPTGSITNPVYVSKLLPDNPNFGKKNTDKKAFGNNASSPDAYDDGPSYKVYYPEGFFDNDNDEFTDSVVYFNNQIERWIEVLAENEKEKVEMELIGNYSFGSGSKIEYSNTKSSTKTDSHSFSFVISPSASVRTGTEICGIEMVVNAKTSSSISTDDTRSESKEETKTTGFVLQEEGDDDQITTDYGWTRSGTIAFKTRGGRTSCPYEGEVLTKYFEPGRRVLSEATMQIEVPVLTVKGGSYAIKVPDGRPATYILELKNESETKEDVWFKLILDETTNPHGAQLKIDGGIIGNGRTFLAKAGEVLEKTLTLEKGPVETKYDNIRLLLVSQCQYDPTDFIDDIFAETQISAEFIPACSDVSIRVPSDRWTVNAETGDSLQIILEGYDVNYSHFAYVDLQYRNTASAQWSTLMKFYSDQAVYNNATGLKTLLGSETEIVYNWKMKDMFDGNYELRARTVCESGGQLISEYITPTVTGVKDMVAPQVFGKPQPENGILTGTDNIIIRFNEPINEGMITLNNFTVTGIKNGTQDDHFTSVHFDGTSGSMSTEQEMSLENKPFTVEFWLKRDKTGAGTIFTHGSGSEAFSIGFTSDNKLRIQVGTASVESEDAITNITEWGHYAVTYNNNRVTAYYAAGSTSNVLIDNIAATAYRGVGLIKIGTSLSNNNYLSGNMHSLRIWSRAQSVSNIASMRNIRLSGSEIGLVGYWPMNEGKGLLVKDKVAGRNAVMNATWKLLPEGKAISLSGDNSYLTIPTGSSVVIGQEKDFSIEVWFKGTGANGALFSCGRGDGTDYAADGNLSIYFEAGRLKVASKEKVHEISRENYLDNKWHSFVLSVKRTGSANAYVDGNLKYYIDGMSIGSLMGANMTVGVRRWTEDALIFKTDMPFKGLIDELRIRDAAITSDYIAENNHVRLTGKETGLVAYYPFDEYVINNNDQKELRVSFADQVEGSKLTAVRTNVTESSETAPVKDAGPVSDYAFNVITSSDQILLQLTESYSVMERTLVTITAKNIYDQNGNKMKSPETWVAYIDQSFLRWEEEAININKDADGTLEHTIKILNMGGSMEYFNIENVPSWMSVSPSSGNVPSSGSIDVTITIDEGVNIGMYNEVIYMRGKYNMPLNINLTVGSAKPNWSVDPAKYKGNMSIYGQLKVRDVISKDKNDIIAAFVNNECVGVASPVYDATYDMWFVYLTVYGNSNNLPVNFAVWDASMGKIYSDVLPNNMTFKSNTVSGTPLSPVMFETTDMVTQSIPLKKGWNWISFNLQSDALQDVNRTMRTVQATDKDEIKGQGSGEFSRYSVSNKSWVNATLNGAGLKNTQMYMLYSGHDKNVLSITGSELDPSSVNIPIMAGWNWISFIPQTNMTVPEALAGLNVADGDIVKSQTAFAYYDSKAGWIGSLKYLRPNAGYMYKAKNAGTFRYPNSTSLRSSVIGIVAEDNDIAPATHKYEHNLSIIATVDPALEVSEGSRLVAGINGENRGEATLQRMEDGRGLFFITVSADEVMDEMVRFSIVSGSGNNEIALSENIIFTKNALLGSPKDPVLFTSTDGSMNVYPTMFTNKLYAEFLSDTESKARILLFDLSGMLIASIPHTVTNEGVQVVDISRNIDLSALPAGVYFVKITGGNQELKTFKVIKK